MSKGAKDHFKDVSKHYASSRPTYPSSLFDWLAAQCESHQCAWDCGTGSGQVAMDLVARFSRVVATDASAAQIAEATAHARIDYRVAPAECSGLDPASVDLVAVAQALHWFDLDRFYPEVRRVLKLRGVFAAWCYGVIELEGDAVDQLVRRFYLETVGPYWPAERRHVETGYRDLPFPFETLRAPPFAMRAEWKLEQLLGYLRSWSATARFVASRGYDPVGELEQCLRPIWGGDGHNREVVWPLSLLASGSTGGSATGS